MYIQMKSLEVALAFLCGSSSVRVCFAVFCVWVHTHTHTHIYIYIYTGCPRSNVREFGRVFLMLNYTDITQNTYIQSGTATEIMAREV